ncbi:MAG: hypothetical protein EOO20_20695, partial [Chryseobacterium sp.]
LKFDGEDTQVIIGDGTTLRECVTVNRGTKALGYTKVGENCLIMATSHIAHDCVLGNNVIIANGCGIAGHVEIGDYVVMGGLSAIQQFGKIGKHAMISGGSLIRKDIPPYVKVGREPISYAGINSVGLRRRGFTNDKIFEIQKIYRAIFQMKMNTTQAIEFIEKEIQGDDYRLLLVGNKMVAASRRSPAQVTGNGISSVIQLVNKENENSDRGEGHENILTRINLDRHTESILAKQGLTESSVPKLGERIYLKQTANLSTGGTAEDVTDSVHPLNIMLAERAAKIIGLDICGIDIISPDIAVPLSENGGAIIEVNAAPGLRMHQYPSAGISRDVGKPVIDLMFGENQDGRIPIVAVTGTNGKTTTTRLMAFIADYAGNELTYRMKQNLNSNVAVFALDGNNENLLGHVKEKGTAIFTDADQEIYLVTETEKFYICNAVDIPLTRKGKAGFMIENVLPVILASYLSGFPIKTIVSALKSFQPSEDTTPGRINEFKINGVNVIVDYAHNPHGLRALAGYLKNVAGHKTGIITGTGDRRTEDIIEFGRIAAQMYDEIIIRFDRDLRGRSRESITELLMLGIREIDDRMTCIVIPDTQTAIHTAVDNAAKESYVVVCADNATYTIGLTKKIAELYRK